MVERGLDWESGGSDSSPSVAATSLFDPEYIIGNFVGYLIRTVSLSHLSLVFTLLELST